MRVLGSEVGGKEDVRGTGRPPPICRPDLGERPCEQNLSAARSQAAFGALSGLLGEAWLMAGGAGL